VSALFESLSKDGDRTGEAALFYERVSPDLLQQVFSFNHISGVLNQQQQSVGGFRRKGNCLVTVEKNSPRLVQAEPAELIETSVHTISHWGDTAVRSR
jgi:hypothetical protein